MIRRFVMLTADTVAVLCGTVVSAIDMFHGKPTEGLMIAFLVGIYAKVGK